VTIDALQLIRYIVNGQDIIDQFFLMTSITFRLGMLPFQREPRVIVIEINGVPSHRSAVTAGTIYGRGVCGNGKLARMNIIVAIHTICTQWCKNQVIQTVWHVTASTTHVGVQPL